MRLEQLKDYIPEKLHKILAKDIDELRPSQEKSVRAGLLEYKNLLVCTPTASGKTLIAELAMVKNCLEGKGTAIYIVPLKALAAEKANHFKQRYGHLLKVAQSSGDRDSDDAYLMDYDIIVCVAEKLDSLLRHHAPWINSVYTIVADEIHLLNDPSRGPTLEIVLTLLRHILKNYQLIALSATIGNPEELASWLDAELVEDDWRPVELKEGIYLNGEVEFYEK